MEKLVFFTREDAWSFAMGELGALAGVRARPLAPGAGLLEGEDLLRRVNGIAPLFLRHVHPVARVLRGEEELPAAAGELTADFPGEELAVQTVDLTGERREKEILAGLLESSALSRFRTVPESEDVLSVTKAGDGIYLGFSKSRDHLTPRAGGIYRYAMTPETVSRAAFKLTEIFERLSLSVPEGGEALDLGAAPGGWTWVLLEKGARVTAVDPAALDPRVEEDPRVTHYRGLSQEYLKEAGGKTFDLLVNDMRMDAHESARVTREALPLLKKGGLIVITLKLPEKGSLKKARDALAYLGEEVGILYARQLYHNRSEITCAAVKP
ncbi:MAG: 50S rRNA methyltransferase [Clostridia bacterium]|nr:50S rRNA methyltransferase [Clostridia bacterium]